MSLLDYAVIGCGPPPEFDNCTLMSTNNNCGSMTSYSPLDSETIRIFGDTELTCGSDGMWQADPVEGFPFCIPSTSHVFVRLSGN